jgi:hypothetical protein
VAVVVEPDRIEMDEPPTPSPTPGDELLGMSADFASFLMAARFPLERATDALDSDRVAGTVKPVVTVS